ncbi:DNA repair protein RecO [Hellea balneolensis]|uniref:DNA repair protein RecO n=1 Tax=Hellea balneolensis TaxID=287478 RepID=UPI0003F769A4|nr:DNA repair protein RecO [Hellea balneolensis]
MEWVSEGYILSVRKHGETSAIIDVFTPDKGRHLGLVRGGVSRKSRPVLQPGNKVKLQWRGRLSEHLGSFTVEPLSARAAELMEDRLSLAGLNAMCAIARECLPEREPHPEVYDAFQILLMNLHDPDIWPALYVRWEAGLLTAMGYGLDLKSCAATGSNDNLTHVSPRSGRAVSASAAEPYKDKLLVLPLFLQGQPYVTPEDVKAGMVLTGYFLETRVQWGVNKTLPDSRARMIERLSTEGYSR